MSVVRITISIPEGLFADLSREVLPRKRSRFIKEAIARFLRDRRDRKLAAEYREAAAKIRRINKDLAGIMADGLD